MRRKSERGRATIARGQSGSGGPLPNPPARIWRLSTWVLAGGYVVGLVVEIAAGATLAVGVTLVAALVAGLLIGWIEDRQAAAGRRCRVCGCTDERPCVELDFWADCVPCHWVKSDLCSSCAPDAGWGQGW